ncbi:SpoIIIAH-like family protein, partial [Tissierella praeacuta]
EYRLSRDKLRASLIDRLDVITNNSNTAEDVRKEAQREIMKLGNNSEKELQIEGLIKGKGFEDAIVFLTDKDIKIVVSTNELSEQDMVKILDIVKSETNYDNNNIKIMKKQ